MILLLTTQDVNSGWDRTDTPGRFMYLTNSKVHSNPYIRENILNKTPNYFRHHHLQNLRQKYEETEDNFNSAKSGPTNHQVLGQSVDEVEKLILADLRHITNNFSLAKDTASSNAKNKSTEETFHSKRTRHRPKLISSHKILDKGQDEKRPNNRHVVKLEQPSSNTRKPFRGNIKSSKNKSEEYFEKNKRNKTITTTTKPKSENNFKIKKYFSGKTINTRLPVTQKTDDISDSTTSSVEGVIPFKHDLLDYDEPLHDSKKIKKNAILSASQQSYKYLVPDVSTAQIHEVKPLSTLSKLKSKHVQKNANHSLHSELINPKINLKRKPHKSEQPKRKIISKKQRSRLNTPNNHVSSDKADQIPAGSSNHEDKETDKFPAEMNENSEEYSKENDKSGLHDKNTKVTQTIGKPKKEENIYQ